MPSLPKLESHSRRTDRRGKDGPSKQPKSPSALLFRIPLTFCQCRERERESWKRQPRAWEGGVRGHAWKKAIAHSPRTTTKTGNDLKKGIGKDTHNVPTLRYVPRTIIPQFNVGIMGCAYSTVWWCAGLFCGRMMQRKKEVILEDEQVCPTLTNHPSWFFPSSYMRLKDGFLAAYYS